MRKNTIIAAVLLAAGLSLTACGHPSHQAGQVAQSAQASGQNAATSDDGLRAFTGDPCTLLKPNEIEALIGSHNAGKRDDTGGCTWWGTDAWLLVNLDKFHQAPAELHYDQLNSTKPCPNDPQSGLWGIWAVDLKRSSSVSGICHKNGWRYVVTLTIQPTEAQPNHLYVTEPQIAVVARTVRIMTGRGVS
jgi:hypothetical protein